MLFLRQQLQQSAARDMTHGLGRSAETLAIEGELAQVQQRAAELHRERQDIARRVQALNIRRDFIIAETQKLGSKKEDSVEADRGNSGDREVAALTSGDGTLGDIGEADERVKKFYGIQQQQQQQSLSAATTITINS